MKKQIVSLLLLVFLFAAISARAQNPPGQVLTGNTTPPPSCTATYPVYVNLASGLSYVCHNGTYSVIGGGAPSGSAGGDLNGTYPNPGVAKVNAAAIPTSKTVVGTNSSGQVVDASAAALANNTSGTAANLSGTPALPNGTTATTQTASDSTTKLATDAFVHANAACPGAGGTPNAFLVDSGTQGTCTDSSVLAGGTAGTFLYNGFTNALPGTSGTLLNAVPTKYTQWSGCNGKGLGTSGSGSTAVAAGTYVENTCTNDTGATVTLTGLNCFTDNSGTSTLNASGHTLGALLTGAITCSTARAAGTQSANVLLTAGDWIVFTFVADGTSKETDWNVTGTY